MESRLTIAVIVSASLALAACGASSSAPSPAAVDPCLVGTWTTVALTENSPANDEDIAYSGGAGEVYTIKADGAVTIDTHAARPVVFVSAGEMFTATVSGAGHGTLKTDSRGFSYKPSANTTISTTVVDNSTGEPLGPPVPDLAFRAVYTCSKGQSFTYYKTEVHHMIDGPKVTLTAGNSTS